MVFWPQSTLRLISEQIGVWLDGQRQFWPPFWFLLSNYWLMDGGLMSSLYLLKTV